MRFILYRTKGAPAEAPLTVGAQVGESTVADITAALADAGTPGVHSMRIFLELGAKGIDAARAAIGDAKYHHPAGEVDLRAPIYDP
jgi:hypothetical protein